MQRWPLVDHSVPGQLGAGARIISKQTSLDGGSPVRILRYQQPEDHPLGRHVLSYRLSPRVRGNLRAFRYYRLISSESSKDAPLGATRVPASDACASDGQPVGSPRRPEPPHKHKGRSHAARRLTIIPHPARRRRGASPAIFPDTSTGRLSPRRAPGLSAAASHDSVTLKSDVPNDDSITAT